MEPSRARRFKDMVALIAERMDFMKVSMGSHV